MASALKKMQQKLKELEEGGKTAFWKAPKGETRIRILQSWAGPKKLFYKEFQQHFGLGPDQNAVLVCLGDKCPACKRAHKLSNSSSVKKQKQAERITARTQFAMNIVDLSNKKKIMIWSTTPNNMQELLGYTADTDFGDFTDPKRGFNVVVRRKGEMLKTRYKIRLEPKPTKLKGWKKIKKNLINLDKRFAPLPLKKFKSIMKNGWESKSSDD